MALSARWPRVVLELVQARMAFWSMLADVADAARDTHRWERAENPRTMTEQWGCRECGARAEVRIGDALPLPRQLEKLGVLPSCEEEVVRGVLRS